MGTAGERTILVDDATPGLRMKHGTGSVLAFRQLGSPRCAKGLGCDEGFTLGQKWDDACQLELAALGLKRTVSLDRASSQIGIDLADVFDGLEMEGIASASRFHGN